jgi:sulfate/thiosulfate transport system substrate-binding protein
MIGEDMLLKRALLIQRLRQLVPLAFFGALFFYALWPWVPLGREAQPRTIVFYGFSILNEVMTQGIFPAFQDGWEAQTGERVEFISSFAGSGTITNQLIMGVPADLALLSLELDAIRLSDAGVTEPYSWRDLPHQGVVNRTPFIVLVRPGNPRGVQDFEDLARPGTGIVHPDPLTSGGANWAIVAEYGAGARARPDDPDAGLNMLRGIWQNVVAQAASARAARTQFNNGFGDALITYEQEVLWDRARGRLSGDIVYPTSTILSEHTLVVVDRNVEPGEREMIDAFVDFLWSEQAQRLFVEYGFRSVEESLNEQNPAFGEIADPFLIQDYGGWTTAKRDIVDRLWRDQVLPGLGQ